MEHDEFVSSDFKLSLPEPFCSTYEQQDAGEFARIFLDFLS